MFLLNSCLSHFTAASSQRHPFSRSYGVILPSSLTMLLPPALGFSPHPPVSVYGTGLHNTIAAFLDSSSTYFATSSSLLFQKSVCYMRICLHAHSFLYTSHSIPGYALALCPYSSDYVRYRNLNLLSIGYALRPLLRSRLTQGRSALPWKP